MRASRQAVLWLVLVLLATGAMLWLYGSVDYTVAPYAQWDLRSYLTMAQASPGRAPGVHQPFAYRVLGPCLVGALPLPEPQAFRAGTTVALLALAGALYLYLLDQPVKPHLAAAVTLLLVLNRSLFGYNAWNYFQLNDNLSLLALVALFWALQRRQWVAFAAVLLLGALARETALLMIPTAAVYLWERGASRRQWLALGLAALPALAATALLRWLIVPGGGMGLLAALASYSHKLLEPESWFRLLVAPWMPLTLLPLLFWRRTIGHFRAERWHQVVFVLLVLGSTLFGQNNERLMAPAFIVFYGLLASLWTETTSQRPRWLLPVTLGLAFLGSLHHEYARYPLPERYWTLLLSLGGTALVSLAWTWQAWQDRGFFPYHAS
jgi:hypothetical protein